MKQTPYTGSEYHTASIVPPLFSRYFPSLGLYGRIVRIVLAASRKAKRGAYGDEDWAKSSWDMLHAMERVGMRFEVSGLENLRDLQQPAVIVGNHMSMLETLILPGIVRPFLPVTFVIKQELLDYPFFKYVMRSRDPIAVGRANPREDLKAILNGGLERLKNGISIIVFPQTTRMQKFDATQFNSIGVKLAQRAQVPVVPLALKTDAWQNGRVIKDFGRIDRTRTVHFAFGEPMLLEKRGNEGHEAVIQFVTDKLQEWQ
ncbi:MAG: 1-acyl-sn-glycerol-3-phosphate acyltransferase [Lentisphaeria bacterium]|nr:1-acyl-sn-glycerol-3-phosphate acyltransferase [Lentisphaeria bacterium]